MHKQIVCAGFRIDMAVVDSRQPCHIEVFKRDYRSARMIRKDEQNEPM
jgi:hypothetical protein